MNESSPVSRGDPQELPIHLSLLYIRSLFPCRGEWREPRLQPGPGGVLKRNPRRQRTPRLPIDPLAVVSGALAERWDRFVREMARCRRRPTEAAIHDLRVAMRRLLAVMSTVESIPPGGYLRRSCRETRNHLKAFNSFRDIQVQLLGVRRLKRRFPVLVRYETFLRRQELSLVRAVRAEIRTLRQETYLRSLSAVQSELSGLYGTPAASRAVRAMLTGSAAAAFGKVLARRASLRPMDPRSVHRMRVAFKKFRYTVELNRPFLPWTDRRHGLEMDAFQTSMGEIQDLEVLAAGLRRFARQDVRSTGPLYLPLFQYLASARATKMNLFLHSANRLESFWG